MTTVDRGLHANHASELPTSCDGRPITLRLPRPPVPPSPASHHLHATHSSPHSEAALSWMQGQGGRVPPKRGGRLAHVVPLQAATPVCARSRPNKRARLLGSLLCSTKTPVLACVRQLPARAPPPSLLQPPHTGRRACTFVQRCSSMPWALSDGRRPRQLPGKGCRRQTPGAALAPVAGKGCCLLPPSSRRACCHPLVIWRPEALRKPRR